MLDVFILQMFSEKLFQIYPYSATRKIFNTLCPNQTVDKEVNSNFISFYSNKIKLQSV